MPTVQLSYPIWVRNFDHQYHLSPLLFEGPQVSHPRFDRGLDRLKGQVDKFFQQQKDFDREKLPQFFWYLFQPEFEFEVMAFHFEYGSRSFMGNLSVVHFDYLGGRVVLLPGVERHMFMIKEQKVTRQHLYEGIVQQLQAMARAYRKKTGELFPLDSYRAQKGEHWTILEQAVFVQQPKLAFETEASRFFAFFSGQQNEFDGRVEVAQVGYNFNHLYPEQLRLAHGRDKLTEELQRQLMSPEAPPVVLLGQRKSGKTTLIQAALRAYLDTRKEEDLFRSDHFWYLDPTRLIAGMSIVGAWQRRLESIIAYLRRPLKEHPERRDVLCIDNLIALFRVGKSAQNEMTISDVLKPYLQRRQLRVVIEATPEAWNLASEIDRSFTDLFQIVRVEEPHTADTLRMLNRVRLELEAGGNFIMEGPALRRLYELQRRYADESSLIGRTADQMRQLASRYQGAPINERIVRREFDRQTRLTPLISDPDLVVNEEEFQWYFKRNLIGQPQVNEAMTDLLVQLKAQMQPTHRPYRSMLFIGPTGVGKTQAAKVLSDYLFTHRERLLRIDMNEYIDAGAVSRLIGDPRQPEGILTSQVRHNPFCVLLLDEIEKAHPEVHDLLLQVLDEGRLTDASGQVASFRNTVIIMTSNLGADRIGRSIRFQARDDDDPHTYRKAIRDFFRPEFINRIDQTLVFRALEPADIERIAELQIKQLMKRQGLRRRKIYLETAPEVLTYLAGRGFDPQMGGRALKRQIEKDLVHLLAARLSQTTPDQPVLMSLNPGAQGIEVETVAVRDAEPALDVELLGFSQVDAGKAEFEQMLAELLAIKEEVDQLAEERQEAHGGDLLSAMREDSVLEQLFTMKDEARAAIDALYDLLRQFQIRRNLILKQGHFRIKTLKGSVSTEVASDKKLKQDQANQAEVDDYLTQYGQATQTLVGDGASLYLSYLLQKDWLVQRLKGAESGQVDYLVLRLRQLVGKSGPAWTSPLIFFHQLYTQVNWESRDEDQIPPPQAGVPTHFMVPMSDPRARYPESYLFLKGLGIADLVQREEGLHRYLREKSTEEPYLIEVQVQKMEPAAWQQAKVRWEEELQAPAAFSSHFPPEGYTVIRQYERLATASIRTHPWLMVRITDLRKGLVLQTPPQPEDMKLLFFR